MAAESLGRTAWVALREWLRVVREVLVSVENAIRPCVRCQREKDSALFAALWVSRAQFLQHQAKFVPAIANDPINAEVLAMDTTDLPPLEIVCHDCWDRLHDAALADVAAQVR